MIVSVVRAGVLGSAVVLMFLVVEMYCAYREYVEGS